MPWFWGFSLLSPRVCLELFCLASMVPWLTLRGLPVDRFEVFSADHRLTFRGLPAECLWVLPPEAASCKQLLDRTSGVLGLLPQEGLSWAAHGTSNPRALLSGGSIGSSFPISDLGETASSAAAPGFLGMFFLAAGGQTVPVGLSAPILLGGDAAMLRLATRRGRSGSPGAWPASSQPRGCPLRALGPTCSVRGISGVGAWIFFLGQSSL